MSPTVSINLCCYNSEKFLEATLQSIFVQTYTDWELVIVNDGSTDSTEQIIQQHMAAGRPIVYHRQVNAGLGAARNKAIELSHGNYIALIDHDDMWLPEKLEKQMALFDGRPHVGLTYTNANRLYPDGSLEQYSDTSALHRGQVLIPLLFSDFVVCSTIVVRRSALEETGWFNPEYRQVEEYDLMLRISERFEFDFVALPLVIYRVHFHNASWDASRMQSETISMVRAALQRNPQLREELGPQATRLKLGGFSCRLGEFYLLRGNVKAAYTWYGSGIELLLSLPRLVILYLMAFLPPRVIIRAVAVWRAARRWITLRAFG